MFVGITDKDEIGIIVFGDGCNYVTEASRKTNNAIKDDIIYTLLQDTAKDGNYEEKHILQEPSSQTIRDIETLLFHKFLIEELENDGYKVMKMFQIKTDITKNVITIE